MTQGVMYDTAQSWYQIDLAYALGDGTPTLHLYSSDDTPTPSVSPFSYTELSNDSYAPLPVPNGYWQFLTSPPPGFYAVLGAAWDLAAPTFGQDSIIYGWWMDVNSPRIGSAIPLFGGRFDTPVSIPPAGLTLTLAEVQLPLHDCGVGPPPPPPPAPYLRDTFQGVTGTLLPAHTMDAGPGWTNSGGAPDLEISAGKAVASANGSCVDWTQTGASDFVFTVNYTHQNDTNALLTFRQVDDNHTFYVLGPGGGWVLVENDPGGSTLKASGTFAMTAGVTYTLKLIILGTFVVFFINNTFVLSFSTMVNYLTNKGVGLYLLLASGSKPTGSYSDFAIDHIPP